MTWSGSLVRNYLLSFMVILASLATLLNVILSTKWAKFREEDILFWSLPTKMALDVNQTEQNAITVKEITNCQDRPMDASISQHGDYWVLANYVQASKKHKCYESVTYTTQGDYTFLDNLEPLLKRWNGPISIALHAPGYDFRPTLNSISYLRNCLIISEMVKMYVTFHIFFPTNHIPFFTPLERQSIFLQQMYRDDIDCYKTAPYVNANYKSLYKTKRKLVYPINVARNIARTNAQTHFVLASDIELYPSRNVIPKFLRMVEERKELFTNNQPKIFVLPVFEVQKNQSVPDNKTVLQSMFKQRNAFYFHKHICSACHSIPNETQWLMKNETQDLNVFTTIKRQGRHSKWEAFYIGTHKEPLFDERLTWEGQSNKMSQGYAMCLLDYDYVVLDNLFLTHRPGIKKVRIQKYMYGSMIAKTNSILEKDIKPQLQHFYGSNDECKL